MRRERQQRRAQGGDDRRSKKYSFHRALPSRISAEIATPRVARIIAMSGIRRPFLGLSALSRVRSALAPRSLALGTSFGFQTLGHGRLDCPRFFRPPSQLWFVQMICDEGKQGMGICPQLIWWLRGASKLCAKAI